MFREIREIKTREKISDNTERKPQPFESIKPEVELSVSELNRLVMEELNKARAEV